MSPLAYPRLLSPIAIGGHELPNRIVSTAHGAFLDFYRPGVAPDQYIAYQQARAAGGCGFIILQPVHVHPSSHALGHYIPEPDDLFAKFAAMAQALHRHGTKVAVQLLHFGAQFTSEARIDLQPLWSFSGTPSAEGEPSHAMLPDEIEEVVAGFADTAALAIEAGLDGVEIHATHGYLVQQSFSPWANRRTDEWGKTHRFLDELIARIRSAIGAQAFLGLRLAADDFVPPDRGGLGVEGLRDIARHAVSSGSIDYLNHSEGSRSSHYHRAVGSYRHPRGEFLPLARGLRVAIDAAIPVIGVGRIVEPAMAEEALQTEACDLVGLTRAQIADAEFASKLATGRSHRIRPCVGANQGCVDRMDGALPITCFHNPDVGREGRLESVAPVSSAQTVLIVGAGPAGLKAAELAARRGHRVTLVDRAPAAGGLLRSVGGLGAAAELLGSISWLEEELAGFDVDLRLGVEADTAMVTAAAPDVVVLTTGAAPDPEPLPTDGSLPLLSTADAAWGRWQGNPFDPSGQRILVIDTLGSLEVALVVEALAERGADVDVVTPYLSFGPYLGFTHRKDLLGVVYGAGCRVDTSSVVTQLSEGRAEVRHVYSKELRHEPFDAVVAGVPRLPRLELLDVAEAAGARVLLAGDAVAPRSALHAFREGDKAGRAI